MSTFSKLYEQYVHLYEEYKEPNGNEIVNDFATNAPKALKQIIRKYFEAVAHNATKYRHGEQRQGDFITPEQFIKTVVEPLAIDNEDNYVVELPVNFTPDVFKEFIRGLSDLSKQDLPDLVQIDPLETKYLEKNIFTNVHPDVLKRVYPKGIKTIDRTNYPGGEIAYKVIKNEYPEKVKEILNAYRLEHTQRFTEDGRPNGVLTFLSSYILPILKSLNWPIKSYDMVKDSKNAQKWGSNYLKDFLLAAQNDISNKGYVYTPATGWKGMAEDTYGLKQYMRELLQ